MYQKDFILRVIEMLSELVAGILGLIRKGEFQKASQSINQAYQDLLKKDAGYYDKIPMDQLTDSLIQEHNYINGHFEILSELTFTQAELLYAQKRYKESLEYFQKSLLLLEFVIKGSQTFSIEKQFKESTLRNRIAELENVAF